MDYVFEDPDKIENSSLITKCFNSLIERTLISGMIVLIMLKSDYKMEPYLCFIGDREIRRNLAKLRCSNHSLLIESERYLKLEIADRICKRCNRGEDETHFLIECSLYTVTRQKFYKDNNISVDNESKETFMTLMKTEDKQLLVNLTNFITGCFEIRKVLQGLY